MKVFLDASVIVAAALSERGGSSRVIRESALRGFLLVTSRYAYREAEWSVEWNNPSRLQECCDLTAYFSFVPEPSRRQVRAALQIIDFKDAPILAAAIHAKTDMLLTLDRAHFISNPRIKEEYPALFIFTPGDFIQAYFT